MTPLRILFVLPAEPPALAQFADQLRQMGHDVVVAAPGEAEIRLGGAAGEFDAVIRVPAEEASSPSPLEAAEKHHIAATLRHTRGNKRQAAHLLGIARSTLLAKVRKYEL